MTDTYVLESKRHVRRLGEIYGTTMLADKLRVSSGTLQNIWRGRLKSISVDLYMRICDTVAAELRREIGHLEHELSVIAKSTRRYSDSEVAKMAKEIARLKALLEDRP